MDEYKPGGIIPTRYEYRIFQLEATSDSKQMEAQLNGLGDWGWQLMWADMPHGQVLMGREKPQPPAGT